MKKLSNTEAELKKSTAYKKACSLQKQLGIILDNRVSFEEHLKINLNKNNKTIELLRKFDSIRQRPALLTIYKDFVRPHLAYGNIIHDQAYNATFHQKLELRKYNVCLH